MDDVELIVEIFECDEAEIVVGRDGDFLCRHTPPKAHRNPVMFAHSFIWSCECISLELNLFNKTLCCVSTSSSCSEFWWLALRLPIERWNGSSWPSSIFVFGYEANILDVESQLRNVSSQAGCTPFTQCSILRNRTIIRFCSAALPIFRNI